MKTAGEEIVSNLKSKTIQDRKPGLKIRSNHLKDTEATPHRVWTTVFLGGDGVRYPARGTAMCDGKGWFVPYDRGGCVDRKIYRARR